MSPPTSDQSRWLALVSRDRSASKDTFVYAVRTTKVFCRPSCPARLARRANIEFYDYPAQAENAGYRACKRCKPDMKTLSGNDDDALGEDKMLDYAQHNKMVQKACQAIREKGGLKRLKELSKEAGLTPSHLHRVFKKVTGVTPGEYGKRVREEGSLMGEDCVKMIDEALLWAESSPENLEVISELSCDILRRENEARDSPCRTQNDALSGLGNRLTETKLDFRDFSNLQHFQHLEASDVNNGFTISGYALNRLSSAPSSVSKTSPDFSLSMVNMPLETLDKITGSYDQDLTGYLQPTLMDMNGFNELSDLQTHSNQGEKGLGFLQESMMDFVGSGDILPFSHDVLWVWP